MVFIESPEDPIYYNPPTSLKKIALVASIAAATQYGWALQLSLLTPYIQLLGVPHKWAAFVWLCGPISGLLVQPTVGHISDRCTSEHGRRRPFLVGGAMLLCLGVFLIGFAADIGYLLGDSLDQVVKHRAVTIFVLGFWILDISNNVIQGPSRALLADLSGDDESTLTIANAMYAFFMAVGNILGYGAGSYMGISNLLPFTETKACDIYCANLKTCFLLSIVFVAIITTLIVTLVKEQVLDPFVLSRKNHEFNEGDDSPNSFLAQFVIAIRDMPKPMRLLLLLTALNWIGWFPFTMFSTDWMGKEVYGGAVRGTKAIVELYHAGVWAGTLGLMLYVITLAIISLSMELLIKFCGSVKRLWTFSNYILAICMAMTFVITKMASDARKAAIIVNQAQFVRPPPEVLLSSLALFAILGIPQAVTYSIPFALASIYTNQTGRGQGLALGVMNLAIVIPQMIVAVVSGPLDSLFGGSNLPAFLMGGIGAALSGTFAYKLQET